MLGILGKRMQCGRTERMQFPNKSHGGPTENERVRWAKVLRIDNIVSGMELVA